MRLLKLIVALVILAVAGLLGYAYLGDMTPKQQQMRVPVTLSGGTATAGRAVPAPAADPAAAPAAAPAETPAAAAAEPPAAAPESPAPAEAAATAAPQPAGADALD